MLAAGPELVELYRDIVAGRRRLIGWGAVGDLRYLLFQTRLPLVRIIDGDPRKWGRRIAGVEIVPPERLAEEDPARTAVMVFPHLGPALPGILERIAGFGNFAVMPPFRVECDLPFPPGEPLPEGPERAWAEHLADLSTRPVVALGDALSAAARPPRATTASASRRVALVTERLTLGGSERQICRLAAGLSRAGHAARLVVSGPPLPHTEELRRELGDDVPIRHLSQPRDDWMGDPAALAGPDPDAVMAVIARLPLETAHRVLALRDDFLADPPDQVVAYMERASVAAGLAALLAGTPRALLCLRSLDPGRFIHYFPNGVDWFADCLRLLSEFPQIRLAANSLAGARACARWLRLPEDALEVIRNAVPAAGERAAALAAGREIRAALGAAEDRPLIAGVFRLVPEKRPLLFLEAVRRLAERVPGLRAVLVGDGPLSETVAAEVERLGLSGRVFLAGPRPEGPSWIGAADLLLHTAAFEGLPNVHLEAQCLGRPVLCFAVGGTREVLAPVLQPLALPDGDMDGLVEAGVGPLLNRRDREDLGAAARDDVLERFGIDRLVTETLDAPPKSDARRRDPVLSSIDLRTVDLVSLDVFDTLLFRRRGSPEEVFKATARAARAEGRLDPEITDDAFVVLRRQAEARARGRTGGEVGLSDIHGALRLPDTDADALRRLELAAEFEAAVANPHLVGFLRDARRLGKPVVLVSDMYLGERDLRALLATIGVRAGRDYDRLYVSGDRGVSKAGGGLFRVMLADRPSVAPAAVIHVGDDTVSDKAGALAAGIRPVHYAAPPRLTEIRRRELLLNERSTEGAMSAARLLAARRAAGISGTDEEEFWFQYGATVMGPPAVHYADWVLRHASAKGIRRIAPLMREGELLGRLMSLEAERLGVDVTVEPLAVSRAALRAPSLIEFGEAEFRELTVELNLTLRDVSAAFGLGDPPERLVPHADRPLMNLLGGEFGESAEGFRLVREYLLSDAVRSRVTAEARRSREILLDYLRDRLGDEDRVALVDIGARGSMFKRLADISPDREFHGYVFYAVREALERLGEGVRLHSYMPLTASALERAAVVYRSPAFLELLLNGEADTTIGHGRDADGRAIPLFQPSVIDDTQRTALRRCREGILTYREQWADLASGGSDPAAFERDVDPERVLDIVHRAVHLPTSEEAERVGRLVFDVNNGSSARERICDGKARETLRRVRAEAAPSLLLSLSLQTRPSEVRWPQGALTLEHPGAIEDLIRGARSGFGHHVICGHLAHLARNAGVRRFALCAAGGWGGMGPAFLDAADEAGLVCVGYADLLTRIDVIGSLPPSTPAEAARMDCRDVVAVSVGYGRDIVAALRIGSRDDERPLRCWWYDGGRFRVDQILRGEITPVSSNPEAETGGADP